MSIRTKSDPASRERSFFGHFRVLANLFGVEMWFHTQMVALFFLSIALGTAMSGKLAGNYDPANEIPFFLMIGGAAIVAGALVLATARPVGRLMGDVC